MSEVFQIDGFQPDAFQQDAPAGFGDPAFQADAFQTDGFQATAVDVAFQPGAFQTDGFQTIDGEAAPAVPEPAYQNPGFQVDAFQMSAIAESIISKSGVNRLIAYQLQEEYLKRFEKAEDKPVKKRAKIKAKKQLSVVRTPELTEVKSKPYVSVAKKFIHTADADVGEYLDFILSSTLPLITRDIIEDRVKKRKQDDELAILLLAA